MKVKIKCIEKYKILYNLPNETRLVILIGGRGGGKTYEASKWVAYSSTIKEKRCVILRDEKEQIKESILSEIKQRYDTANQGGILDNFYEIQETGIKNKRTGEMQVFTKGFRASDNQKSANLKGVSDIDISLIEEAEDVRDVSKYNTFSDSLRKNGAIIVLILNTPDIRHWIIKRYFNLELVEDGYYKITPKKLKGFVCIQSNFTDNPFLPDNIIEQYKSYGNPESVNYDLHYYRTAILGYASTGRRGQILTNIKPISLKDYMALNLKEYFGQDFGTAAPAGLIGAKFSKGCIYVRELNYKPMSALELAILYSILKLTKEDLIIADNADKKSIQKLKNGFKPDELPNLSYLTKYPQIMRGFFIKECSKVDGIQGGITLLKSQQLYFVEESLNLWIEAANYIYAKDKFGNSTNDPIDDSNHLIDPLRYVADYKLNRKELQIYG